MYYKKPALMKVIIIKKMYLLSFKNSFYNNPLFIGECSENYCIFIDFF